MKSRLLRAAKAQRRAALAILTSPAVRADAKCGDADARRALDSAAENLAAAEAVIAGQQQAAA